MGIPPFFGHRHLPFCGVLPAHLEEDHDMPQPSVQHLLPLHRLATQLILLDGFPCTVVDEKESSHAQQFASSVSADTSVADESPVESFLQGDGVVLKRME